LTLSAKANRRRVRQRIIQPGTACPCMGAAEALAALPERTARSPGFASPFGTGPEKRLAGDN